MKTTFLKIAAFCVSALIVTGCATGPKYQEVSNAISSMKPDEGRIFFLRSSGLFGAALQPDIRLNGVVVGESKPGGFFYVNRPAGSYVVSTSTETEKTASFALIGGETKYVRTSPSFGVLVGRVVVELEAPEKAKAELATLNYTGGNAQAANSANSDKAATTGPKTTLAAAFPPAAPGATKVHITAEDLIGRTWSYPHPRRPAQLGQVEMSFAAQTVTARNSKTSASGTWRVQNDVVCSAFY